MKKTFLFEVFWFFLAQVLGILVAQNIMIQNLERGEEIIKISPSEFSILNFLVAFLIVVIFILIILKFGKGKNVFFKSFFILVVIFGGEIFLETWLPIFIALPLLIFLIFAWVKISSIWLHNLLLIFGVAGLGGLVGISLSPLMVISLFLILAIYDFIAVYKIKVTQKIAKSMVESQALLGIIIPSKFADFQQKIKEVKIGEKKQKFLVLGGGDIVFPLILASSVLSQGVIKSWIIIAFSLIGLLFGYWLFFKLGRKPMPALPPLALFSIIGYLITRFV
jgi:presenilin-like A22 family membrane protease